MNEIGDPGKKMSTRLFRILLVVAIASITYIALSPRSPDLLNNTWDKMNHAVAFCTLSFLVNHSFPNRPFDYLKVFFIVLYGLALETGQYLLPDRYFSLLDLAANSLGIILYAVLMLFVRKFSFFRLLTRTVD